MKEKRFLIGAATAAHQVEGNNTNNDTWALEQLPHGGYPVKSGIAANHYETYRDDIRKLHDAGCNAYRFSLEWSRIEPEEGKYDYAEVEHYRDVIRACHEMDVEPIVTLFHFTSPVWLIRKGGWSVDSVVDDFARYTRFVAENLLQDVHYICTLNESNIGVLIAKYIEAAMREEKEHGALQIGVDVEEMTKNALFQKQEYLEAFGTEEPSFFVAPHNRHDIDIVKRTHKKAVEIIHQLLPEAKAGITLSLRDIQWKEEGRLPAEKAWNEEFSQFVDCLQDDDFFGLQNYTRTIFAKDGELPVEAGKELTEMKYEYYPEGLGNVIRRVHKELDKPILVTENGIATLDDTRRCVFIDEALAGVKSCKDDGIDVIGYCYWSMIDNYEWQSGYDMHFGLMKRDEAHTVRNSLYVLGKWNDKI